MMMTTSLGHSSRRCERSCSFAKADWRPPCCYSVKFQFLVRLCPGVTRSGREIASKFVLERGARFRLALRIRWLVARIGPGKSACYHTHRRQVLTVLRAID